VSKQLPPVSVLVDAATAAAGFGAAAGAVDDAAAAAFGVNRTDLRIIGTLHQQGALTAGQLAEMCGLSPAATSTAIQRLVGGGHVTRAVDSEDRRRAVIAVTGPTVDRLEAIYRPVGEAGMTQLAEYSPGQLVLLTDFLRRGEALQHAQAERIRSLH
jgi:DNA-binding transcriptional ArsR family regulator